MKQKPVKIYGNIYYIVAGKKTRNIFNGETFQHEFDFPATIYGMPDGSIWIKGEKPLWDMFQYKRKGRYVERVKQFHVTDKRR